MADSPLNNSWPSFSKLWMKRWSFKRGSECKPCTQPIRPTSSTGSSSSLSPTSIAEGFFFSGTPEDKNNCLAESDFECSENSVDDLLDLSSSLRDSEYFRDLQAGSSVSEAPQPILHSHEDKSQLSPALFLYPPSPCEPFHPHCDLTLSPTHSTMNLLCDQGELAEPAVTADSADGPAASLEMDSDPESFPILVRSMSTSRRHSWDVPLSPVGLGRRFSLDTTSMDSDVEREEESLAQSSPPPSLSHSHSSVEEFATSLETESSKTSEPPTSGRTVYSRSDILASDEKTHAEKVSRILETSKQAARAAGEENDSEEGLQSADGQCHMLMVQKVLQELKLYHGAKRRTSCADRKDTASVTWYEFLSNENEEEEDRAERSERGTKVKRTLSSLRNRMTGSFNKDKGKNREKDQQREKGREREKEKEREPKEKTRRTSLISRSVNGHQLVTGSFSSLATCSLCSKSLQRKHGLQCLNCAVNVHKSCKNLLPECSNSKNKSCVVQPSANGAALTGGLTEDTTARWVSVMVAVGSVRQKILRRRAQGPSSHLISSFISGHRTLPTGRCPQDAAHRMLSTGHCWLDGSGWWTILSPAEVSSSTAVSDPLTPAPHTLTHQVSVTAVLRMIHHPHHTYSVVVLWGSCPLKNRVIQYTEKQMEYSLDLYTYRVSCMIMELAIRGHRTAAKKSPHPSASWGLSRRVGVRVLLHRDLLTCRFLGSVPRSWLRHYCRSSDPSILPAAPRESYFNPPHTHAPAADGSSRSSRCAPGMTVPSRGPSAQPAAPSSTQPLSHTSSSSSIAGEMDEVDAFRIKRSAEDAVSLAPSTAESVIVEVYSNCLLHHVSVTAVLRMIRHPHRTCSVVVLWGSCPFKNRVIQYTEKQMDYSLDLYTYRVSYMVCVCLRATPVLLYRCRCACFSTDAYYYSVRQELDGMAQDFEVESWSLAVEQQFLKKHSKDMIKRQDVIYELIQTEMHHVRTLKIMLRVYVYELRETLQLDERRLGCLFPRLDSLLDLHSGFLSRLKERRQEALQPGSERNYAIDRVADILTEQFSGECGERMKESYGAFCSRHTEAVTFYKEQLQSNKKFLSLIRKISNLSIVRRLGIPECILLVTQRITKYPVLVERLLQYTQAGTEEHEELSQALDLIKDTIVKVDTQVSLYEKETRLKEIASKLESRSLGKIKDGRIFRKEDLTQGRRRLLYEGTVNWKAASGRLKDILAVLLTDVLLLLQEKDQRYVFSAVDSKPSVISLQKLIVREVAHEEKAMFLICASSNEPEMYEIHTSSKEERNTWITYIRQAAESCPHTEERLFSEEEEAARALRLRDFQERLTAKDAQIMHALTDKLQLFAELAESVAGVEDAASRSRLLLRGDASDLQQGEQLLKGAITEVENLQNLLASGVRGASPHSEENQSPGSGMLPKRADTFGGYDSNPTILQKNGSVKKRTSGSGKSRERNQRASSDPQLKEIITSQGLEETDDTSPPSWNTIWLNSSFPEAEFFDRVLLLAQRLYSLQSIVSQQDSQIELQRASLFSAERDRPGRPRGTNVLLEQEKQRNLEKQREELANFQRLQAQHRQEQARWERERERQQRQAETAEQRLQEREEECRRLEARLTEERQELEKQRQKYQQDLERLRESTRAVEKEKERLEQQQKKLKKHNTLPSTASLYSQETGQFHMGDNVTL
ncbi:hypothetical protein NFI96_023026 [Prochilodus magdalenae]|nr:hypothetical protein NFI96_023026 [Prochilodus magdalenae]